MKIKDMMVGALILSMGAVFGAEKAKGIECEVFPTIGKSIRGVDSFERKRFVNLAASPFEIQNHIVKDPARLKYMFEELDISLGRALGMVGSKSKWGNSVREDKDRAGYVDLEHLKKAESVQKPDSEELKKLLGKNAGVAMHDSKNAYPKFMKLYTKDEGHSYFPEDGQAAGELAANILKYSYNDFTRPEFYEPVNEPSWQVIGDKRFTGYHVDIKRAVDKLGLDVLVGGPCNSVSYYYKKGYASMNSFTKFIDATNNELDFYSFHSYDYMRFDPETKNTYGSVSSGLGLEGVLDAMASYTFNKYGKELTYITSEHGAYTSKEDHRLLAVETIFGKVEGEISFEEEMKHRGIENFVLVNGAIANTMSYMSHPHIVKKAVPFILLETSAWNTRYYSSLFVRRDFDRKNPELVESGLINFYKFFQDVKGKMIYSYCDDSDIQHHAFVDGDTIVLLFHNLADVKDVISLNLNNLESKIENIKVRRITRDPKTLTGKCTSRTVGKYSKIRIAPQESIAMFIKCSEPIKFEKTFDEKIFYATKESVQFKGSETFTLNLPKDIKAEEAFLRVGLNAEASLDNVEIWLNSEKLTLKVEDSSPRYVNEGSYTMTKIVKVPVSLLKLSNEVKVDLGAGVSGGVGAVVLRVMCEK